MVDAMPLRDLLARYDKPAPRYTSYPPVPRFDETFGAPEYKEIVQASNEDPLPRPLSLYVHIPFCRSLCYYCACNKIITQHFDKGSVYRRYLEKELELQAALFDSDRVVTQLHLGGGTPTFLEAPGLERLMAAIDRHFRLAASADREFSIEIDPREVEPAMLRLLRDAGFDRASIGVQDFNAEVQRAVNRIQPPGQTLEVIAQARQAGFTSISVDLIYGLPQQTPATFAETIEQIIACRPERISVYNYAHLPQRFRAQRLIKTADLPAPADKLQMLEQTITQLEAAGYRYIGMDHFALPDSDLARALDAGSLHRNFQGYATHGGCDLIGVGVSAIGSVADCYHQNTRILRDYYRTLDAGELPVVRGLVPSTDDRIRRAVIQEILCRGQLYYEVIENRFDIRFEDYFAAELDALATLEADGLVDRGADRIDIRPRGRLLLRNIAVVFDAYQANSGAGGYSRTV